MASYSIKLQYHDACVARASLLWDMPLVLTSATFFCCQLYGEMAKSLINSDVNMGKIIELDGDFSIKTCWIVRGYLDWLG